jgi:hypothetical protein
MPYREKIKNGVGPDTMLLVSFEDQKLFDGYRIFNGHFVDYDCRDGGSVASINWLYGVTVPMVRDLRVRAQAEDAQPEKGFYGFEARYHDVWEVTLPIAQSMLGTLTKIDKALTKYAADDGSIQTIGQYALRICKALGVKRMISEVPMSIRLGNRYDVMDLATGQTWIDIQVLMWKREKREALDAAKKQEEAISEMAQAVS